MRKDFDLDAFLKELETPPHVSEAIRSLNSDLQKSLDIKASGVIKREGNVVHVDFRKA